MMEMGQYTGQLPMRVASPQLVAANHILALSSAELQAAIQREVSENPAMEAEETPVCPQCGRPLQGTACQRCGRRVRDERARQAGADDAGYSGYDGEYAARSATGQSAEDEYDPMLRVATQISLAESLTRSLQAQFPQRDGPLIEYLVGNLDDDGRLRFDMTETVELFDAEPARIERIISALQAMEPVGVGARDLRECLLIQLDYIEGQGVHQSFVREVIGRFLTELSEHKHSQIAFALGTTTESIHQVGEFIRHNLNPFPARGRLDGGTLGGGETAGPISPDVIITRSASPEGVVDYEVEVVESRRFYLRVNPDYEGLSTTMAARDAALNDADRRHIQHYVSRARLFIANIKQRRQTLGRITRCIVRLQRDFLDEGVRHLHPLTRAKVATELGMHESTVSRATAAKFVMLPTGQVIPFSNFFVANLSVKDVIKDLIDHEAAPLTDQDIAAQLATRGFPVARRTVAKYREQLGVLPSTLR